MNISFKCDKTRKLFERISCAKNWETIQKNACRKLDALNSATDLKDLRSPPGNKLEKLTGNRQDQYSVRINDQWRICFTWSDAGPMNIEIIDYH
jgi:toxin HigB-1